MQSIFKLGGEKIYWKFEIGGSRFEIWKATCPNALVNEAGIKAVNLERRFILFASQVIKLCPKLRKTVEGRHISAQILRSSTATAANYAEARGAESRSDFVHKMKVVLKELNETVVWLMLIQETLSIPAELIEKIVAENQELCRIIAASIRTARNNSD